MVEEIHVLEERHLILANAVIGPVRNLVFSFCMYVYVLKMSLVLHELKHAVNIHLNWLKVLLRNAAIHVVQYMHASLYIMHVLQLFC